MKICHTLLCMNPGGAENVVATLSNYWVKENKDVDIVIFVGDDYPIFYHLDPKIKIHKLDLYGESKNLFEAIKRSFKIIKALIKIYRELKPDVVIAHGNREITLSTISALVTRRRVVGYIHNDQSDFYKDKSKIWRLLEKIFFPLSDNLIIMDKSIMNKIPLFSKRKAIQINNPVEDKYFNYEKISQDLNIIHVGSFVKRKNQLCLIKAFNEISSKHPTSKLILIGEGPEKDYCQDLCVKLNINNRVEFLGNVKNVKDHLQRSSLFIMPSFSEGMSIAILEALATGLPLITTDYSPFHRRVTINGKNGYLVKVNDEYDMADKIDLILKNNKLRIKMSEASKNISKEYSVKLVSNKWDQLFNKFN